MIPNGDRYNKVYSAEYKYFILKLKNINVLKKSYCFENCFILKSKQSNFFLSAVFLQCYYYIPAILDLDSSMIESLVNR